ncbi:MAG: AAA family ATPase [Patescibacteria group bacterium]
MLLNRLDVTGFKSFAKKTSFDFATPVVAIVGPNGSGKSNVAESIRFVLGEQSMKSMRGKRGEDLIWNGTDQVARAGRASVALAFDNQKRFLPIDFDEVVVERVVHRDGVNEYKLNGSVVRLKDILELLAAANIGESGHHIISQGEADRILTASPKDRREMLEDALGLKMYQYRKEEAIRKLDKTAENIRQVEALMREVAPHIRFLKKAVEKIERAEEIRVAALDRYRVYFKREDEYLKGRREHLSHESASKKSHLTLIESKVNEAKQTLKSGAADQRGAAIVTLSRDLDAARAQHATASSRAARIDGQLETLQKVVLRASVSAEEVVRLASEGEALVASFKAGTLKNPAEALQAFIDRIKSLTQSVSKSDVDIDALVREREAAVAAEGEAKKKEIQLEAELASIRIELEEMRSTDREKERMLFELASEEREVRHELAIMDAEKERLMLETQEFERELAEAVPLIGRDAVQYHEVVAAPVERVEQEREKRELEKIKIRLEEMGGAGSEDLMKEYTEASEREAYLTRELADLSTASGELHTVIESLESELRTRFDSGLDAINDQFSRFFGLMFDGGSASLVRHKEPLKKPRITDDVEEEYQVEEDEAPTEFVEGIEVSLTIPRKRIKSLVMLSGGERALTSIALIFAMSSVNPPPFLILDETDAALDEANSRRYGDMVKALSDKSQLVVITHNRETMSRAGVLYGVTMGGDGVSKVLSVKLEEAVKVAK